MNLHTKNKRKKIAELKDILETKKLNLIFQQKLYMVQ
jgi:hypothetical protein